MKVITKKHTIILIMAFILAAAMIWIPDVYAQEVKDAEMIAIDGDKADTGKGTALKETSGDKADSAKDAKKESTSKSKKKVIKSAKKSSKIEIKAIPDKAYDATPISLTKDRNCSISGSEGSVTFTYYKVDSDNSNSKTKLDNAPVNVGTYSVKAELAEDDEYTAAEDERSFKIVKTEKNDWKTAPEIKDYALGNGPKPLAEAIFGEPKFTYASSEDGEFTSEIPSSAGIWYMKASVAETDNYNGIPATIRSFSVTVPKDENEWIRELTIEGWTYDKENKNANAPVAAAKFGKVIFTYSSEKEEPASYSENVPTNAGTYYVKATVLETEEYTGLEEIKEFEILKAMPTYTAPTETFEADYGQTLSEIALPAGFAWEDGTLSVGDLGIKTFKATYTSPEDPQNYQTIKGIDITVNVNKATNKWTKELTMKGWTYGATESQPDAAAKFGEVSYAYSSKEEGPFDLGIPSEPGTWYVKASVPETDQYTGLEATKAFKIAKATPEYNVPEGLKATYGQTLSDVVLPEGFTWSDKTQSVGNVGTKTFKAVYTPKDTAHYVTVEDIDIKVTVEKATNEWIEKLTIKGWTYNSPNAPTAKAKFGDVIYLYSSKKDGNYTSSKPVNAGTWYVMAKVKETENYTGLLSDPVSFKIEPKDGTKLSIPTITQDNVDKFEIKDGSTVLKKGTDYDVTKSQKGDTVTVTIKFKNNYTGTVTKTYKVKSSSSSTTQAKSTNSKKTGDDSKLLLYGLILALSGTVIILMTTLKRKSKL